MSTIATERPKLDALRARLTDQRDKALHEAENLAERVDPTSFSDETLFQGLLDDIDQIERSLDRIDIRVKREPLTYEPDSPNSYFRDLVRALDKGMPDFDAKERLERHRREMQVELEVRARRGDREFRKAAEAGAWDVERRTNMSRVTGQGGEFAPPLWLIDRFTSIARADAPLAALSNRLPLPNGVQSISVPKGTAGSSVATQTDLGAVSKTDMTTSSATAAVRTFAGEQVVSLQLLEQTAPPGFDAVMGADLEDAFTDKLESQLLVGTGSGNQVQGVITAAGVNVTWTDTTPTVPELLGPVANAASQAANNRKRSMSVVLAAPRRWYWVTGGLDSANRPLFGFDEVTASEAGSPVGSLAGIPTYLDAAIPTNLGTGSNEDRIVVCRPSDFFLWLGAPSVRVVQEKNADTLEARVQLVCYGAFMPDRYANGIGVVAGTGLVTPAF